MTGETPSAGTHESEQGAEARLGVLFVHGIGQQQRGDTLLAAGEALHEWIARWFTGGKVARGTLRGLLTPLASDPDAPAHVYTEMTLDDEVSTWLLAESWWAESFPPPTFADLAIWGFQVMPWTLTSHFGTRARRAARRLGWSRGWAKPWNAVRLGVDVALLLVSFVILVPLVVLFGLLALIGAVPIRGLRALVGRIQRALSSSLGDSYVLLTSPITAAAIEETVRRDLGWLAARCDAVAVVAHSQGAAIAHAVLREEAPDNVELFVSVGSGLNKLGEMQRAKERVQPGQVTPREGPTIPYAGSVGLGLLGYAIATAIGGGGPEGAVLFIVAVAGLMLVAAALVRAWRGYPLGELDDVALPATIEWVDVYASADPVPNGPLLDPSGPPSLAGPADSRDDGVGFDQPQWGSGDNTASANGETSPEQPSLPASAVVHNRGSILRDHSDYWRNRDGFMGVVAQQLSLVRSGR